MADCGMEQRRQVLCMSALSDITGGLQICERLITEMTTSNVHTLALLRRRRPFAALPGRNRV